MRAARPAFVLRYKKPSEVSAKGGGSHKVVLWTAILANNKDMVASEGLEPPPPAFLGAAFLGVAPFILRSSYCRRKAITFLDLLRLSPFLVDNLFLNCAYKSC